MSRDRIANSGYQFEGENGAPNDESDESVFPSDEDWDDKEPIIPSRHSVLEEQRYTTAAAIYCQRPVSLSRFLKLKISRNYRHLLLRRLAPAWNTILLLLLPLL
jgi:hypothetical protein